MATFTPMGPVAPALRPRAAHPDLVNLQLLNALAGNVGSIGKQFQQQQQLAEQRTADQALAAVLGNRVGGQLGAGGMGPPTPPNPGAMPTPEQIQAMVIGGRGDELASLMPSISPLDQAKLDIARQKLTQPDLQVTDILRGDQRVNVVIDRNTGQIVRELGTGPAFAPPTQINVGQKPIEGSAAAPMITLPGTIAEIPQIEEYLFPGGKFDRTRAGLLMVPGLRELGGAGGPYASIRSAVQAKLRRESGATITDDEVDEQLSVYLPSPLDTPASARSKWERFKREVLGTLETSMRGRGDVPPTPEVPPLVSGRPGIVDQALNYGASLVDRATGQSGVARTPLPAPPGAVDIPGLPTLDQLNTWTHDQAESFIDGLSDEQMTGIPPGIRDQFIAKLQGRT